jgi:hypothetical protein
MHTYQTVLAQPQAHARPCSLNTCMMHDACYNATMLLVTVVLVGLWNILRSMKGSYSLRPIKKTLRITSLMAGCKKMIRQVELYVLVPLFF